MIDELLHDDGTQPKAPRLHACCMSIIIIIIVLVANVVRACCASYRPACKHVFRARPDLAAKVNSPLNPAPATTAATPLAIFLTTINSV